MKLLGKILGFLIMKGKLKSMRKPMGGFDLLTWVMVSF